jgi:hypothetical protein
MGRGMRRGGECLFFHFFFLPSLHHLSFPLNRTKQRFWMVSVFLTEGKVYRLRVLPCWQCT